MKKSELKNMLVSFIFSMVIYGVMMFMMSSGVIGTYWSGVLILACINIILASSLNLASGYLGQLTLGHAGFMSVGAYVAALTSLYLQMPLFVGLIFGAIVAAGVGLIIGIPTLRLKGDYLCIITLAFNEIIRIIMLNLDITNGAKGLMGIPPDTNFTIVFICVVLTIFIISSVVKSRFGRAIISIREDETASELTGIPTSKYKIMAFVISAFFAGLAGGLYAHYMGMLLPSIFDYNKSVEILVMVVLGGMGNIKGSIIAALLLTILPEYLRAFNDYRMLLYAVVLIAAMILKEKDLIPHIKEKFSKKKNEEVTE
jgi:ABC-type branched-chain amino acid transport system, permease component